MTSNAQIMGVLNVTPDSFSDGGHYFSSDAAIKRGIELIEAGADIIDIGPESTSFYTDPNKKPVSASEQLDRALPVIDGLVRHGVRMISIDTTSAEVAKAALEHGVSWINDQQAGCGDPLMPSVMRAAQKVVLMHGFGMGFGVEAGEKARYQQQVMAALKTFFHERITALGAAGVEREKIIIDPGFGFGKGLEDSLTILGNLAELKSLQTPILIGLSRKSFIGKLLSINEPIERDGASLGGNLLALLSGVEIIRTHNVKMLKQAKRLVEEALARKFS